MLINYRGPVRSFAGTTYIPSSYEPIPEKGKKPKQKPVKKSKAVPSEKEIEDKMRSRISGLLTQISQDWKA
jgi:hypothetical protein